MNTLSMLVKLGMLPKALKALKGLKWYWVNKLTETDIRRRIRGRIVPDRGEIRLTLRPEPGSEPHGPDKWQRLRRLLKRLLRSYGWKCVRIEPVNEPDDIPGGDS